MFRAFTLLLIFVGVSLHSVEFVLFTQPKTATHLLIPILTEMTNKKVYWAPEYAKNGDVLTESLAEVMQRPDFFLFSLDHAPWSRQQMDLVWETTQSKGAFLHLHAPYSLAMESYLADKNCVNFFVKRDPRDQIISLLNHYKYIHFNDREVENIPTDDARLLYMIKDNFREQTIQFMNWLNSQVCCVLDFEKLLGTLGGVATRADAVRELKKMARALQLELTGRELAGMYDKHLGSGWSFFRGKVGVWKDYFNDEHKRAVKEEIGDLLIQLGYEKDLDW